MEFLDICRQNQNEFSSIIADFLRDNPDVLGWRGKAKPDPNTNEGRDVVITKMRSAFTNFHIPSMPETVPDRAVATIMDRYYEIDNIERAVEEHRKAMAAENFVGYALELYIFSVAHEYGWCLCPNAVVKSVDFVKREQNGRWRLLQVKNRNTSENSSSSKVRDGTEIEKWFRTFSKRDATNWENFPDGALTDKLNEQDFQDFIVQYLAAPNK